MGEKGANVRIPQFLITGNLRSATCDITKPFVGELVVQESSAPIRSIELQLVRVETCGCADGYAKERECPHLKVHGGSLLTLKQPLRSRTSKSVMVKIGRAHV